MGTDHRLMCKDCNEYLPCGRNGRLYAIAQDMVNFNCFIVKHADHSLHFNATDGLLDGNYLQDSKEFSIDAFARDNPLKHKQIVDHQIMILKTFNLV